MDFTAGDSVWACTVVITHAPYVSTCHVHSMNISTQIILRAHIHIIYQCYTFSYKSCKRSQEVLVLKEWIRMAGVLTDSVAVEIREHFTRGSLDRREGLKTEV